jgi:hypothetical protein
MRAETFGAVQDLPRIGEQRAAGIAELRRALAAVERCPPSAVSSAWTDWLTAD